MTEYLAQGIGLVGMTFAFISFQKNSNKGIVFFQILGSGAFAIHFLLLGALTGSMLNVVGVARNMVFYNRDKKWANNIVWMFAFCVLYVIVGIVTWKNIYSILPTIGMVLSTVAFWIKNPKHIRMLYLPSSPCWMIYNIVNSSIAGIMTESFASISLIIAIIRFDILKQEEKKRQSEYI